MTLEDPFGGEKRALEKTIFIKSLVSVLGTRRIEPAVGSQERRYPTLVYFDHHEDNFYHSFKAVLYGYELAEQLVHRPLDLLIVSIRRLAFSDDMNVPYAFDTVFIFSKILSYTPLNPVAHNRIPHPSAHGDTDTCRRPIPRYVHRKKMIRMNFPAGRLESVVLVPF